MARPFNRFASERLTAPKLMLVAAALPAYAGAWTLPNATNDLGHDPEHGPPPPPRARRNGRCLPASDRGCRYPHGRFHDGRPTHRRSHAALPGKLR